MIGISISAEAFAARSASWGSRFLRRRGSTEDLQHHHLVTRGEDEPMSTLSLWLACLWLVLLLILLGISIYRYPPA
jgi:hypothetical protein